MNSRSGGGVDIYNATANKVLTGTAYADSIANQDGGDYVTISSGAGNDTITNTNGGYVLINAGDGNDSIRSSYSHNTIQAGAGDDTINMFSTVSNHVIIYNAGDGNELIRMFGSNNTLNIAGDNYSTAMSGEDIIITVGTSKITLSGSGRDGRDMPQIVGTYGSSTVTAATPVATTPAATATATTPAATATATTPAATATAMTTSTPIVSSSYVYAGGDQIISNYANEPIVLGTAPTGAFFGGGNFALTSPTGTLFIQNANDKIIDFRDGAGNPYAKAYAATNPGVIDGRGLAGYEVITGSDFGSDWLYAGDGGSQLWGGSGFGQDILTGGGGADIFIGGKNQGADVVFNAGSADTVNLNDATLSDIIAASEANGVIALAFNNGNAVAVQSSELLSSAFVLADGSAYRFNHAAKVWQNA